MILGIGCDVVDVRRIEVLYEKYNTNFLTRILSLVELKKFNNLKDGTKQQIAFLAKRFAGKEAVAKALGTGIGKLSFSDISIINNELGAPFVVLPAEFLSNYAFPIKINISISDEWPIAIAFVVISR